MKFLEQLLKEPVGLIALVFSILTVLVPTSVQVYRSNFYYDSYFDLRCSPFDGSEGTIVDQTIHQEASCILTNNSGSDLSVVGVRPTLFSGRHPYPELWLPQELKSEPVPTFLRDGESKIVNTIYYVPILSSVSLAPFDQCTPVAELQNTDAMGVRTCHDAIPQSKSLLQSFYEGEIGGGWYELERTGLTIELGNGRDIYYQPAFLPADFNYANVTFEEEIEQRRLTEGVTVSQKWSTTSSLFRSLLDYILVHVASLLTAILVTYIFFRLIRYLGEKYETLIKLNGSVQRCDMIDQEHEETLAAINTEGGDEK